MTDKTKSYLNSAYGQYASIKDYVFDLYIQMQNTTRIYVTETTLNKAWIKAADIACGLYGLQLDRIELVTIVER